MEAKMWKDSVAMVRGKVVERLENYLFFSSKSPDAKPYKLETWSDQSVKDFSMTTYPPLMPASHILHLTAAELEGYGWRWEKQAELPTAEYSGTLSGPIS